MLADTEEVFVGDDDSGQEPPRARRHSTLGSWVRPWTEKGRTRKPLQLGLFPACGFRLFLRPDKRLADTQVLAAMALGPVTALDDASPVDLGTISIADLGPWLHIADAYGIWNDKPRRKAAIFALAKLGELFTFLLPDPDLSYAFAAYRSGKRVRLRVVDSPGYNDQVLRIDQGPPLPGEPAHWRGDPFPMMVSMAKGLGIETDEIPSERFYGWGPLHSAHP